MNMLNNARLEVDRPFINNSDTVLVTTNHYYSSKECIGQGATSNVYKGHNRGTGEERALKISKQSGLHIETQREIEAFLVLRHPNIVTFYGIEDDIQSGKNVIVMEYCSGGSLFCYLQEPENKKGLSDTEFKILLKDLSAAIEKLHSCGFIHRDIKPGNVLRSIHITGKSVYKISDFGSARSMEPGDHLISLAGTEEYLHPKIYDKAFINRSHVVMCKDSMDRWSLGATLCHAATGEVPFKPHGGARRNRGIMFEMISKKPSGKIRGTQEKDGGRINWFDDLPVDCNMTEGLRVKILPIISGLMETDEGRQWTLQTFFSEVDRLSQSIVVFVLNTDTCSYHTLYMPPQSSFAYIAENVAAQTEIPSSRQNYYIDNKPKDLVIKTDMKIKDLLPTSKDKPFVCDFQTEEDEHAFPDVSDITRHFPEVFILSNDCKISMEMSVKIYNLHVKIKDSVKAQNAMMTFSKHYGLYVKGTSENIERDIKKEIYVISEKFIRFRQTTDVVAGKMKDSSLGEKYTVLVNKDFEIRKVIEMIKQTSVEIKRLYSNAESYKKSLEINLCSTECVTGIKHAFEQSKEIVKSMSQRRKSQYLTHWEEIRHKHDKKRILECMNFAMDHWKSCCKVKSQNLIRNFNSWMRYNNNINEKLDLVRHYLVKLQNLSREFTTGLTTFSVYREREWSLILSSGNWKSLQCKETFNESTELIKQGKQLMQSLSNASMLLEDSCNLDKIGDITTSSSTV